MKRNFIAFSTIAAFLLSSGNAAAYIGPGASISAIGTVIALIGAVLLGILGFVWYPIKRLLRQRATAPDTAAAQQTARQESDREETSGSLSQ